MPIDPRFRNLTLVVETWSVAKPPEVLEHIIKDKANAKLTGVTGTVTVQAQPHYSFRKYPLDRSEGIFNLASPHFANISTGVDYLHISFGAISGCTHISVAVMGIPY